VHAICTSAWASISIQHWGTIDRGAEVERQRRENRGAVGTEGGGTLRELLKIMLCKRNKILFISKLILFLLQMSADVDQTIVC